MTTFLSNRGFQSARKVKEGKDAADRKNALNKKRNVKQSVVKKKPSALKTSKKGLRKQLQIDKIARLLNVEL